MSSGGPVDINNLKNNDFPVSSMISDFGNWLIRADTGTNANANSNGDADADAYTR